ncbi:MAG: hypothetical protein QOJ64_1421 [Acidobacteriota bacterium]|jgi:hypothetical protein|nr:hypothetical protein [Acidobacteriota bacterium]
MSISLAVKVTKPILISRLLTNTGEVLAEILGLSFTPSLEANEYVNQEWVTATSEDLTADSNFIGIKIAGEPETAPMFVSNHDWTHAGEVGRGEFAIVDVGGGRTPLDFAIAAAVAAAIGRAHRSEIEDYLPYFTPLLEQSADDFVAAIKVRDKFDDYRQAASVFHKSNYAERVSNTG